MTELDELTRLRALGERLRSEPPNAAAAMAARRALNRRVHGEGQRSAGPFRTRLPRLAAIGGLTVAAALTLGVVTTVDFGAGRPVAAASAAEVLNRAADTALASAGARPRDDQFTYAKARSVERESKGGKPAVRVRETWQSVNSTRVGLLRESGNDIPLRNSMLTKDGMETAPSDEVAPGQVDTVPPMKDPAALYTDYRSIERLPADPAALLERFRARHRGVESTRGVDELAADDLFEVASSPVVPPKHRAAVFRALAMIPGAVVQQDVTDLAGRKGIGVVRPDKAGWVSTLILDSGSYRLLGSRSTRPSYEPKGDPGQGHDTVATSESAVLASGVVDKVGQTPR